MKHYLHKFEVPRHTATTEEAVLSKLQRKNLDPAHYRIYKSKPTNLWVARPKTPYFVVDVTNGKLYCRPGRAGTTQASLKIALRSGQPANYLWVDLRTQSTVPAEELSLDFRFMVKSAAVSTMRKLEQFAKFRRNNKLETVSPKLVVMNAAELRRYVTDLICFPRD